MAIKFRIAYSGNARREGEDMLEFILALIEKFVLHNLERDG